jgi:crossover junction endodeoxyribonuclease RusA
MSTEKLDPAFSLSFPIELVIRDTPRSLQGSGPGVASWKRKVGEIADAHVKTLNDFVFLDNRPLAVAIFYFPPTEMEGDIDNIVKPILDGMKAIVYLNDRVIERVTVQKVEPGVGVAFHSLTPRLEQALENGTSCCLYSN